MCFENVLKKKLVVIVLKGIRQFMDSPILFSYPKNEKPHSFLPFEGENKTDNSNLKVVSVHGTGPDDGTHP